MPKKTLIIFMCTLVLSGCVSQTDFEKLKNENEKLRVELEELQNGEERTIALIEQSLKSKAYQNAKTLILKLKNKHPESKWNEKFERKSSWIDESIKLQETKERELKELAEKKLIKEAQLQEAKKNRENTGVWTVRYYVDDFGKSTKSGYISTKDPVVGFFSNSATQNSKLKIDFLLSSHKNANIMLYEYAGRNPVKSYMNEDYKILVQDKNGNRYSLNGKIWKGSDRINLDEDSSKSLHSILKKGGRVQFRVKKIDSLSEYSFELSDVEWYYNAYKILHNIK